MSSWGSYPSIFNIGHKAMLPLLDVDVIAEEKVDGCLAPTSRILKADLTYCAAGLLDVGDELVGFDDTTNDPRLRKSIVTAVGRIEKPCSMLEFDDGRSVTASQDHPWLVRGKANNLKRWKTTEELVAGDEMVALPIWDTDVSRAGGYLAGAYDGEGSLVKSGSARILSFYQRSGAMLDFVKDQLSMRGFDFSSDVRRRKEHYSEVASIVMRGKNVPCDIMRFLGSVRPHRLLPKAEEKVWDGLPTNSMLRPRLIRKKGLGKRIVIGLSTSTGTYIGEGMLCHNSQFSFAVIDGELRAKSKGKDMDPHNPSEKMFAKACIEVVDMAPRLTPNWTYRGEYLAKPKHNHLAYSRVPAHHIIVFDVNCGDQDFLSYDMKLSESKRLGLECVPLLWSGKLESHEQFRALLDMESVLGGAKIEGVVLKPVSYDVWAPDHKILMAKFVSEVFKEEQKKTWRSDNPTRDDIVQALGARYKTEARWRKAVQHLREAGAIEGSPSDIGKLLKEIPIDIESECRRDIADALYAHFWPQIRRIATAGFPEWYKDELAKSAFEGQS